MSWNRCSELLRVSFALFVGLLTVGTAMGSPTSSGLAVLQTTPSGTESGGLLDLLPFVAIGVIALVLVAALLLYLRRRNEPQDPLS